MSGVVKPIAWLVVDAKTRVPLPLTRPYRSAKLAAAAIGNNGFGTGHRRLKTLDYAIVPVVEVSL